MTVPSKPPGRTPGQVRGRKSEKISDHVAGLIAQDIRSRGLVPGDTLPSEAAMVARFDIGRGSLREALRILEVNGLVTIKTGPGGGPVVSSSDAETFGRVWAMHLQSVGVTYRELLDAQSELEAVLARRAAEGRDGGAAELVRTALEAEAAGSERLERSDGEVPEVPGAPRGSREPPGFHAAVGLAAGNPVLALSAGAIRAIWSGRASSPDPCGPDGTGIEQSGHEEIARAIEGGDPQRSEDLMREHMQRWLDHVETRYPSRMDDVVDRS